MIELLVVVAIVAILTMIAAPSLRRLSLTSSVNTSVSSYMSDMRFARSEAIRRGGGVVMCRSDSPEVAAPTCGTGGAGGTGWASGWIIFHDKANTGNYTDDDELIRQQGPIASVGAIVEPNSTVFSFTATGRLRSSTQIAQLVFGNAETFDSTMQRIVCVDISGRARIAGDGSSSCTAAQ